MTSSTRADVIAAAPITTLRITVARSSPVAAGREVGPDPDRQVQQHRAEDAGVGPSCLDGWDEVKEHGVDETDGGERQRERWCAPADCGGADPEHDQQSVGCQEIRPGTESPRAVDRASAPPSLASPSRAPRPHATPRPSSRPTEPTRDSSRGTLPAGAMLCAVGKGGLRREGDRSARRQFRDSARVPKAVGPFS
jgi:hypothetical protein